MKLIEEIFLSQYILAENKLIDFGFIKDNNNYFYNVNLNNNLKLKIIIKDKIIDAKVIDQDFNDDNEINLDIIKSSNFIINIKEICKEILLNIRENCYVKRNFISEQGNRIAILIEKQYNSKPEFLWKKWPTYGIFRNNTNDKWFAIIMNINKNKLVKDCNEIIEIINLKIEKQFIDSLKIKNVFPSYHMNKKSWISIILDDTLDDKTIMNLVSISYNTVAEN